MGPVLHSWSLVHYTYNTYMIHLHLPKTQLINVGITRIYLDSFDALILNCHNSPKFKFKKKPARGVGDQLSAGVLNVKIWSGIERVKSRYSPHQSGVAPDLSSTLWGRTQHASKS